jgi:hypothetical protein
VFYSTYTSNLSLSNVRVRISKRIVAKGRVSLLGEVQQRKAVGAIGVALASLACLSNVHSTRDFSLLHPPGFESNPVQLGATSGHSSPESSSCHQKIRQRTLHGTRQGRNSKVNNQENFSTHVRRQLPGA